MAKLPEDMTIEQVGGFIQMIPGGPSEELMQAVLEKFPEYGKAPGAEPAKKTPEPTAGAGANQKPGGGAAGGEGVVKVVLRKTPNTGNPILDSASVEEVTHELKTVEDVVSFFKEQGFDDMSQVVDTVSKSKSKLGELEKIETQAKSLQTLIESLPEELFALNNAFWNNGDWKGLLSQIREFDYTRPVDKVPAGELISKYFPTSDPSILEESNPAYSALLDAAKSKYAIDQDKHKKAIESAANIHEEKIKVKKASIQKSREHLSANPLLANIPSDRLEEIERDLVTEQFFNDTFFMPDGSFKPDALEKALILKYGKDALSSALKNVKSESAQKATEELLKAQEALRQKEASGGGQQVRPEIQQAIESMRSLNNKNVFDHVDRKS